MLVALALEPFTDEVTVAGNRADLARSHSRLEAEPSPQSDDQAGAILLSSPLTETPVATSPQSEEARAVAAARTEAEPASALLQPLAVPAGLSPASAPETEAGSHPAPKSGIDAAESSVPLLTPVDEPAEGNAEVPVRLILDLGPEPSISEAMARSKSRFSGVFSLGQGSVFLPGGSGSGSSTTTADGSAWWPAPAWVWGLLVLAALATVLVILLGLAGALSWRPERYPRQTVQPTAESAPDAERATGRLLPIAEAGPAIVVRSGAQSDPEDSQPATNLLEAINAAMGSGGSVELRSRKPLRLPVGQTLDFTSARGNLVIRAAPGIVPVLEIELSADKPFLATGSAVRLVLSGLEIRIRHHASAGGPPPVLPPVLKLAGPAQIERCAFRVSGGPRLVNSCALAVDGSDLVVNRCWFQGCNKAVTILAYNRTVASIRQTMIVPDSNASASQSPAPDLLGWGVEVRLTPGGTASQRRLILDHCTVEGAGLLDLPDGSVQSPIHMEVTHCAVRADALLAWNPAHPQDRLATKVKWQGQSNLFEILGPAWIVRSSNAAALTPSNAVTDLASWSQAVGPENEPIRTKLRYRTDPAERSGPLKPEDFAIDASDAVSATVGADPGQVGPWSR
jgi:hypothetical protein